MTTATTGPRSIEDLYADDTEPAAAPAVETASTQDTGEATQSPTGSAPAAGDDGGGQGAPPAPSDDKSDRGVPRRALQDERRKRQQSESDLEKLRREFDEFKKGQTQAKPAEKPEKATPDPLVDPDGYKKHLRDEMWTEAAEASREEMIEEVGADEFQAAEAAFIAAARADPDLAAKIRRSRDPGRLAYREGKKLIEAREKAPADAEAALLEKLRAKLEQDYDLVPRAKAEAPPAKPAAPASSRVSLPTSLAGMQSAATRSAGAKSTARRSIEDLYDS